MHDGRVFETGICTAGRWSMPDHRDLTPDQWAAIGREIRAQRERDGLPPYRGRRDIRVRDVLLTEFLIGEMLAGRWKGASDG